MEQRPAFMAPWAKISERNGREPNESCAPRAFYAAARAGPFVPAAAAQTSVRRCLMDLSDIRRRIYAALNSPATPPGSGAD